jgi:ribonucleotide reductase alpha subunit
VIEDGKFDFDKLAEITRVVTRNLNKVIDINYYPIPEAKIPTSATARSAGRAGLGRCLHPAGHAFRQRRSAKQLNKDIFETIYFAAMTESCALAKNGAYETFPGSP